MKTCCIIGHRDFKITDELTIKINDTITHLINKENVTIFLFGSKSNFTDYCYKIVTKLLNKYPYLKRIYIRAEYPIISDEYYDYLKTLYEESYFYCSNKTTNKFSYIRRNQTMIDKSDICLFYFNNTYVPKSKTNSGTSIAYEYALKINKTILNIN